MMINWTYVGQTDSRTLRMGLAVFLSLVGMGGSVKSQSPEYTSQLYDACVDVARLTPETSGEATFLVDDPSIVNVEIYSDLGFSRCMLLVPHSGSNMRAERRRMCSAGQLHSLPKKHSDVS